MARASDFLSLTNARLVAEGVVLPLPGRATSSDRDRLRRGREVQSQIVGGMDRVEAMYVGAPEDERYVQLYLSANCFGDHVARGGLDLGLRELLTFAMLAGLGGCEPQLRGHVAANLNVGNGRARLLGVLTALIPYVGYPRSLNALSVLDEVNPRVSLLAECSPATWPRVTTV